MGRGAESPRRLPRCRLLAIRDGLPRLSQVAGARRQARDLGDELAEDGIGKLLETVYGDDKRTRPADDIVAVISVEARLDAEDGQAIDADAGRDRLVAGELGRATAVVGAVPRDVDDAPRALERALRQQTHGMIDRAAQ